MILKEAVAYYTSHDSHVYCTFLDATKAFDRIGYAKMFEKLLLRRISPIVIRFLIQLYVGQVTRISWDSTLSAVFSVHNGVRQGAISSSILFCLYIDELLIRLKNANVGCYVGNTFLGALCYADDLTLLAPTPDAMRKMLEICNEYAREHNISFNASKSKCMLFSPSNKPECESRYTPTFFINKSPIDYVDSWLHLGNILSIDQNDSLSIASRRSHLIGQINNILCTFGKLSIAVKTDLLYKFCSSFYGSVLWDLQRPDVQRICSVWRDAMKRIWRLPRNTHSILINSLTCNLPTFDELCRRFATFHFKCLSSCNRTVNFICRHALCNLRAQSPHGRNLL